MIRRQRYWRTRLDFAHSDLSSIAALLSDLTVEVWTFGQPEGGYSLRGWRDHFVTEGAMLSGRRDDATERERQSPDLVDHVDSYPRIVSALQGVLAAHRTGGVLRAEALTTAERATLVAAITAELEP